MIYYGGKYHYNSRNTYKTYYNKPSKYKLESVAERKEHAEQLKERSNKILDEVFKRFQTEEFPEFVAKEYLKPIDRPSDNWSLSNRFIMYFSGTADARGFRQWNQVSRRVKPGVNAIYILAPNKYMIKKEKNTIDENTKQLVKKVEDIPVFFFKPVPVFRIEDTEGEAVKYVEEPRNPILPLKEVFDKFGLKIVYDRTIQGEYGSFNHTDKTIRVCTPNISTAFHELVHAVHQSTIEELKGGQDADQEIIAQVTALVLAKIYGFESPEDEPYTFNYVNHYSNANGNRLAMIKSCMKVIGKIQKILDKIFEIEHKAYHSKEEDE